MFQLLSVAGPNPNFGKPNQTLTPKTEPPNLFGRSWSYVRRAELSSVRPNIKWISHFTSQLFVYNFSGWCAERRVVLNKPKGYRGEFSWDRYLEETRSKAVSNWAFKTPKNEVSHFKKGMKLEVIDKWNPIFCRVATVVDVAFHQIKIHFDGWPLDTFDFWTEDYSPDIHPVSWCAKTGHPLMPPLSKFRLLTARSCFRGHK